MVEFGKAHGFSDEEMAQVYDSRAVVLLRKAWLHNMLQEKHKALKRAKAAPTIRPGPSEPKSKAKASKAQKAQHRLVQTGKLNDAQAAIEALL